MSVQNIKQIYTQELEEDINGNPVGSISMTQAAKRNVEFASGDVAGDGVANGTIVGTLAVPANKIFIATKIMVATGVAMCGFVIGVGANLAAAIVTNKDNIFIPAVGTEVRMSNEKPVAICDNSAGAVATNFYVIAPFTFLGNAVNNAAAQRLRCAIQGYLI